MFLSKFIAAGEEYATLQKQVPAPYFRKVFSVKPFKKAELFICGLGFYELYLNGKEMTKGKLAPYVCNPDLLLYYDRYDVTECLQTGKNALGVLLGNGFLNGMGGGAWSFDKAAFRSSPRFSVSLFLDGEKVLQSDESFLTAESPVYFDDLRIGEYYDARKEQDGWNCVDFDDSGWKSAIAVRPPKGEPTLCGVEPIRVLREIKPVRYFLIDAGWLFDFGVNTSGVCRLRVRGHAGQKITLAHGEALLEDKFLYTKNTCTPQTDSFLSQKDIYICKGGEEEYVPHFTFHGFRYVYVEGIGGDQVCLDTLTLLQLGSSLEKVGEFSCSNETVNALQRITVNSDISNFFYYPLDCPQREKNGWTADAALSCEQMNFNFDCYTSLREWLKNIRYTQAENGALPGIVPTAGWGFAWGNGPAWDIVLIELPYQLYRFTGKTEIIQENAAAIQKYVAYLQTRKNEEGLFAFGLGDWCDVAGEYEGDIRTPLEVTDSLTCLEIYEKAGFLFSVIGEKELQADCKRLYDELLLRFREKYVDEAGYISCRTQTAQAKALSLGIFTDEEQSRALQNLLTLIREKGNRFSVGVIGGRVLFRVLCDYGYADLALQLITQDGFPSYKYWLDKGATSLWEAFNETYEGSILRLDGGRVLSMNHHFWGDISALFYRYLLGLHLNPDGRDCTFVEIAPCFVNDLQFANGRYHNERGGVSIAWEKRETGVEVRVKTEGEFHFALAQSLRIAKEETMDGWKVFQVAYN